jgi:predicted transglutaminase-like cysteine proteinase
MRQATKALAVGAMIAATCGISNSQAAFFSYPRALLLQLNRISFEEPTLAPMAHIRFCMQYADDCRVHGLDFRKRTVAMTVERLNELNSVNREVNRGIIPQPNLGGVATEEWLVSPPAGDCNDYAVTKRHELLARGWPSRSLLLSEVVVPDGQHHLVLVARMKDPETSDRVDLVLDNLNATLRPVGLSPYRWVRVESPNNPKYWSTVSLSSRSRPAAALARPAPEQSIPSPEPRLSLIDYANKWRIHGRHLLQCRAAFALGDRQS